MGSQHIQSVASDLVADIPNGFALNLTNGNDINLQDALATGYTASYRKDGLTESFFQGSNFATVQTTVGGGGASSFLGATNTAITSNAYLRTEVFATTDSLESHESPAGAKKNMAYQSQGNLTIRGGSASATPNTVLCGLGAIGNNLTCNAGNTTISTNAGSCSINSTAGNTLNAGASAGLANPNTFLSAGTGGQANPMVRMENTGASSGSVALEVYRNKGTAGIAGDVLYNMSVYGRDSIQNKQEFTRITHTIRDPTNTAEDGSIEFGCFVNGAFTNMLQLNGNDVPSGEVNVLKPLDLTGNALKTSTGSMSIDTSASSTAGATLTLATKDNVAGSGAGLVLTGNTLLNASAGGNSGQHLCLTIGGTVYKIALLNA
jgi:hypothetical protein